MSIWIFLLWIASGIAVAIFWARRSSRRTLARTLRKHLHYLKPYTPSSSSSTTQGAPCD